MSTVVRDIEARIGEDVREPCEPAADLDVSGWGSWEVKGYFYADGTLIATIDSTGSADGQIIRSSAGEFVAHWKRAFLDDLTRSRNRYFRQIRRVDSGNNYVLIEGAVAMLPYQST